MLDRAGIGFTVRAADSHLRHISADLPTLPLSALESNAGAVKQLALS